MKSALALLSICLALGVVAADDETVDLQIAARPKPKEFSSEQLQALVKRLAPAPVTPPKAGKPAEVPPAWEKSDAAAKFATEAREQPELFARLLVPPNFARAVPRADKDIRTRAAWVLGLTRDRRAMQPLIDSAVYDPEESVRLAAADALVMLEEPVALRKLVDLAVMPDYSKFPWVVRKNACHAVIRYGSKDAVERLLRELSYELAAGNQLDPKNRLRGVPGGLGTDNPMMLPDGPPDLHLSEQDLYPVLSALKEVTGKTFDLGEKDMKTWLEWWKKDAANFKFAR